MHMKSLNQQSACDMVSDQEAHRPRLHESHLHVGHQVAWTWTHHCFVPMLAAIAHKHFNASSTSIHLIQLLVGLSGGETKGQTPFDLWHRNVSQLLDLNDCGYEWLSSCAMGKFN